MSAYTNLLALQLTAGEQALLSAVGMTGADGNGQLSTITNELKEVLIKLNRMTANIGAGANKTAIDAYITAALT